MQDMGFVMGVEQLVEAVNANVSLVMRECHAQMKYLCAAAPGVSALATVFAFKISNVRVRMDFRAHYAKKNLKTHMCVTQCATLFNIV